MFSFFVREDYLDGALDVFLDTKENSIETTGRMVEIDLLELK